MKKIFCTLIIFLSLVSFCIIDVFGIEQNSQVYSLNDDFSNNQLIVSLKPEYSKINNEINISNFITENIITKEMYLEKEYNINIEFDRLFIVESIKDLTYFNNVDMIENSNGFIQILLFELFSGTKEKVLSFMNEIIENPIVLSANPNMNYYINPFASDSVDYFDEGQDTEQWGLEYIDVYDAWNLIGYGELDEKIKVGIVDGGVQSNHPDLSVANGNFQQSTNAIPDHGTHIAGIIGAKNNDYGVTGIAQVTAVPLRYVNDEYVADSIQWAINNGIKVLNMSFDFRNIFDTPIKPGEYFEQALKNYSLVKGVVVCAAGNHGVNIDQNERYPACYANKNMYPEINNVISVGGLDSNGNIYYKSDDNLSNYGENSVSIYAPGKDIYSTLAGGQYGTMTGTSMATPHVTGVVALIMSINSNLNSSQIVEAILESAIIEDITLRNSETQSVLKLNAYNAVKYVLEHFSNSTYEINDDNFELYDQKYITSGKDYFDYKNCLYKLDIVNNGIYEFKVSANNNIEAILYNSNFEEVNFDDLDTNGNAITIIKEYEIGVYYLRIKFVNENSAGLIKLNNFKRIYLGNSNILFDYKYDIKTYVYTNNISAGFYKISLNVTNSSGTIAYPEGCIKVYADKSQQQLLARLETIFYTLDAETQGDSNNVIVFLEYGESYYINIDLPSASYSSMYINIERLTNTYDIIESNNAEEHVILNENTTAYGDYIQRVEIHEAGTYTITFTHEGPQSEENLMGQEDPLYLYYSFYKEVYSPAEQFGDLEMIFPHVASSMGGTISFTFNLQPGVYYIGYYNKLNNEPMSISIIS